ncbi:hypothetical protein [Rhodococcus sp. NPDC060176]|uniref:hypothetical protein n=1 Tax=Rhodococcus sp. NPDC060176 TaxID=3347062 RepID=UPI00365CE013
MADEELETPKDSESLYAYKGDDATLERAHFTGDVFDVDGAFQILVQHPCALRRGMTLHPKLLTAQVREVSEKPRTEWKNHRLTEMPLPGLRDDSKHYVADFDLLSTMPSESLKTSARIAVLSQFGVNVLSQRWVYHNSRVLVPTRTFDLQTFGPYNEAELSEEWAIMHPDKNNSAKLFDEWIRDGQPSRQSLLADQQTASAVRREMRQHLNAL